MTTHIAKASGSWQSRVGIAFLLMLVAMGAIFASRQEASAFDSNSSTTFTLEQDKTGPVVPGEKITYTVESAIATNDEADGDVRARIVWANSDDTILDYSLVVPFDTSGDFNGCNNSGTDQVGSSKEARCTSVAGDFNNQGSWFSVQITANQCGTIPAPGFAVYDTGAGGNLGEDGDDDPATVNNTTAIEVVCDDIELRHVDDGGDWYYDRDVVNNVRGHRHYVCFTNDGDIAVLPGLLPEDIRNGIASGGGYTSLLDEDPDVTSLEIHQPTDTDYDYLPIWEWDDYYQEWESDAYGATCFSWISTAAGDQQVEVDYGAATIGFDNDTSGNGSLIKQWNVLEESCIEIYDASYERVSLRSGDDFDSLDCSVDASESNPTVHLEVPAYFDPSDSTYIIDTIGITDYFVGSHVDRTGGTWRVALWGVEWDAWIDSTCGEFVNEEMAYGNEASSLGYKSVTSVYGVTGHGGYVELEVEPGDDCVLNDRIVVVIEGWEPGPLGSGDGNLVRQVVVIDLVTPQETKQVFLAWAGQRVIIEHDWRLPMGDTRDDDQDGEPENRGVCVFDDDLSIQNPLNDNDEDEGLDDDAFIVKYTAQQGSVGTWLSSLGAIVANNNTALVVVDNEEEQQDDEVPFAPQENCISRAIYQSNFPGEVVINVEVAVIEDEEDDVEIWRQECGGFGFSQPECGFNQTNREVVIYYMKMEKVETTLVTALSKPTHNAAGADWAPGNPWDVSLDVTSTDANVSEDVLVRIRVTGWFLSSNQSGRPAVTAAEDPLNPRPANRWVMPYDWAMLAGGPSVPDSDWTDEVGGTAEDFSPHYDLMFAPNNNAGIDMYRPEYVESGDPPFEGPLSLLDYKGHVDFSAALSDFEDDNIKWTTYSDGDIDRYDAPMPSAELTVNIRGAGFIREVLKEDVYYVGTPDTSSQVWTNPYYITDIPASPFIPAQTAGGGYLWNTWSNDGPGGNGQHVYRFWESIPPFNNSAPGTNTNGVYDNTLSAAEVDELELIRDAHGDDSISRTLVVYTDNHGEAMVAANGDFNLDYRDCAVNPIEGGHHCDVDDVVGDSTIWAVAQYPDAKGHHAPVTSNTADITWLWGGYKEITIEDGETEQFKYVVFHALDRDAFCSPNHAGGGVSLHPVLSSWDEEYDFDFPQHHGDPVETVDFLIDGGEGRIVDTSDGLGPVSGERTNAFGITTFSTGDNVPAVSGIAEFPTLNGGADECQAWIRISSSLLDTIDVLAVAHDDEGDIGFDELINFTSSMDYTLNFRWNLVTWAGADGISPEDALSGEGLNEGGNDIFDEVTAVYGWNQAAQTWLGFFPAGVGIPGVNDLTELETGKAYWIAIVAPGPVNWTIDTDVN